MKKQLLVLALGMMSLPIVAMAATPDFTGSWARDNANSDPAPSAMWLTMSAGQGFGGGAGNAASAGRGNAAAGGRGNAAGGGPANAGGAGRGAGAGGGRGFAPQAVLTIHQDANKLQVESQGITHEYALDGKPHTVPTDTGIEKAVVTANLQGDTLLIDTTEPYGGMPGNATLNVKEVWSLSSDGNTLTVTTTRDVPAEKQTFKQVYNRAQAEPGSICSAGCITLTPR